MSDKSVRKRRASFRDGCENFVNDPRPGQVNAVITADLIGKVDDLLRSDWRVPFRMLAANGDNSVRTSVDNYSDHPTNNGGFTTFRCQKLNNPLVLLNHRILQCEHHLVLIRFAASNGHRSL